MGGRRRGRAIRFGVAALTLALGTCTFSDYKPYDDGTLGDLGQGFFYVWETFLPTRGDCSGWYGCHGPVDDQRIRPLGVGATAHVGFSAGGCVRAEDPAVASSPACGVVTGVAPGDTRLVAYDGETVVDYTPLHVRRPTALDVRTPWGDLLETLVSIGFDEALDTVVVLTAGEDLMGVGRFALESDPPACVHAAGYGRYFRLTPLCTGRLTVTYRSLDFDASDVLRLEVREPTRPVDGGRTERDAGGPEAGDADEDGSAEEALPDGAETDAGPDVPADDVEEDAVADGPGDAAPDGVEEAEPDGASDGDET